MEGLTLQLPTQVKSSLLLLLLDLEEVIYMLVSAYLLHLGLSCCQDEPYFSFPNGAQDLLPYYWL